MTESAMRLTLVLAGVVNLALGLLALIAPGTFFDEIGRYGLENSHYVGDNGSFTAAAGIGLLLAVNRPSWRAPLLWVGAIWFGLHALNHLFDVDEARSDARGIFDTVALALVAVLTAGLAKEAERLREAAPPGEVPP
jgi:hypothetical protein